VSDDGVGFEVGPNPATGTVESGYGMQSMTERAELVGGELRVVSRPGSGTTIVATVPAGA
jgi:signal transduction histidine kinase